MKRKLMVWAVALMIVTMALQIRLIRTSGNAEPYHEVAVLKEDILTNSEITERSIETVRIAESSMQPWMLAISELTFPIWSTRHFQSGDFLKFEYVSEAPVIESAEVALRLDPQDVVAYQLNIGESIDLLGIRGTETPVYFKTLTVSNILGQDLKPVHQTLMPPMYLILNGEKKEIFELCRIKSTYTFQVIKKKSVFQKEG